MYVSFFVDNNRVMTPPMAEAGAQGDNLSVTLKFTFPEGLRHYRKRVKFEAADGSVFAQFMSGDKYPIRSFLTAYDSLDMQIQFYDVSDKIIAQTTISEIVFGDTIEAAGDIPPRGGIEEAPDDGTQYGRQNKSWTPIESAPASASPWKSYMANVVEIACRPGDIVKIASASGWEMTYNGVSSGVGGQVLVEINFNQVTFSDGEIVTGTAVGFVAIPSNNFSWETVEYYWGEPGVTELAFRIGNLDGAYDSLAKICVTHYENPLVRGLGGGIVDVG